MPLLSPTHSLDPEQINSVLKESGLTSPVQQKGRTEIQEILNSQELGLSDLVSELSYLAKNGGSEAIRLKAAELALKLHGALVPDQQTQVPSFQIIIQDSESIEINPILIPR